MATPSFPLHFSNFSVISVRGYIHQYSFIFLHMGRPTNILIFLISLLNNSNCSPNQMTNTAVNSGFPNLTDSMHDLICQFELRMINDCSFVCFCLSCLESSGSPPNIFLRTILGGHVMIMCNVDLFSISFLHFFFFCRNFD